MITLQDLEARIAELDQLSQAEDDMWAEARSQWLASWTECPEEDWQDRDLDELEMSADYWLEGMINDVEPQELEPGGLYHWMIIAQSQMP